MRRTARDERGASFVEFALILPLFFAIALAALTGGISYDRKLAISHAAREASRFGATLPVGGTTDAALSSWLTAVANATEQGAAGSLDPTASGRSICVAYVYPNGNTPGDRTGILQRGATAGTPNPNAGSAARCFDDGLPATVRRVQVRVARTSKFEAFFFSRSASLTDRSVNRFEASPS